MVRKAPSLLYHRPVHLSSIILFIFISIFLSIRFCIDTNLSIQGYWIKLLTFGNRCALGGATAFNSFFFERLFVMKPRQAGVVKGARFMGVRNIFYVALWLFLDTRPLKKFSETKKIFFLNGGVAFGKKNFFLFFSVYIWPIFSPKVILNRNNETIFNFK